MILPIFYVIMSLVSLKIQIEESLKNGCRTYCVHGLEEFDKLKEIILGSRSVVLLAFVRTIT